MLLPVLINAEFGGSAKRVTNFLCLTLLVMVGVVFVKGPAGLLAETTLGIEWTNLWAAAIFAYYVVATLVPVDKIIGRLYPVFGAVLILMTTGLSVGTLNSGHRFPALQASHPDGNSFFPTIFVVVSCSAVSGFHSTQTPMMARCIQKRGSAMKVFYGAMIVEGGIGLVWAWATLVFYGGQEGLLKALAFEEGCANGNPAVLVTTILTTLLGNVGGAFAMMGVVVLPVTSGDTAFRAARLIIAEALGNSEGQKDLTQRLRVALPLFVTAFVVLQVDFGMIWQYFNFVNQLITVLVLWCAASMLRRGRDFHWVATVPAVFMTLVVATYLTSSREFIKIWSPVSTLLGSCVAGTTLVFFLLHPSESVESPSGEEVNVDARSESRRSMSDLRL